MELRSLLEKIPYTVVDAHGREITDTALAAQYLQTEITDITNDSRKAFEGVLFYCIVGANSDGHAYAENAIRQGAAALLIEHDLELDLSDESLLAAANRVAFIRTDNTRYGMALASAAFYGYPATRMRMIGITGTKGKTTTTYLVKSILDRAGIDTGLIGTIETNYHEVRIPSDNTTPESIVLQKRLRDMADAGVQAVVMEVSSQALMMDRTAGILYDIGVFTNLSIDHVGPNEHASFEDYLHCKGLLFRQCKVGIVNGDDEHTQRVLEGHTCEVETYGFDKENDLYAEDLTLIDKPGELGISFHTHGMVDFLAEVPTPGRFSVYNALSAIAICHHFGVAPADIQTALLGAHVKGRIEMVKVSDAFTLLIDYAHNAVALESLLTTLRDYHPHRLVTVFGCGGNRSKTRRYEMGEVAGRLSDYTIITSDNPRYEEPDAIIADIVIGMQRTDGKYITITDRKSAIAYAIHHGEPGDIVILAGKGHEDYQEICGVKHPMDERVLIQEILDEDRRAGQ